MSKNIKDTNKSFEVRPKNNVINQISGPITILPYPYAFVDGGRLISPTYEPLPPINTLPVTHITGKVPSPYANIGKHVEITGTDKSEVIRANPADYQNNKTVVLNGMYGADTYDFRGLQHTVTHIVNFDENVIGQGDKIVFSIEIGTNSPTLEKINAGYYTHKFTYGNDNVIFFRAGQITKIEGRMSTVENSKVMFDWRLNESTGQHGFFNNYTHKFVLEKDNNLAQQGSSLNMAAKSSTALSTTLTQKSLGTLTS